MLICGESRGIVQAWRLDNAAPLKTWRHHVHKGRVRSLALATPPDGTVVAVSAGDEGQVCIWRPLDTTAGTLRLTGHEGAVLAVAAGTLPDGSCWAVSGGADGTVRRWHLSDGAAAERPVAAHVGGVTALALGTTAGGTAVVVSGGDDATLRVWRMDNGTELVPGLVISGAVSQLVWKSDAIVSASFGSIAMHRLT
jgi:WD40 repeat protein